MRSLTLRDALFGLPLPPGLGSVVLLGVGADHAYLVSSEATAGVQERSCLLFLGKSEGSALFYDYERAETIRIPASDGFFAITEERPAACRKDGDRDLYIVEPNGAPGNATKLAFFPTKGGVPASEGATEHSPAWSLDGREVAFSANWDGDEEIYVADVSGQNVRQLTDNDAADRSPVWSSDGSRLLFVSGRDGNPEIYRTTREGTMQENLTRLRQVSKSGLTRHPGIDTNPSWSKDGDVAFASDRAGKGFQLYLMRIAQPQPEALTAEAHTENHSPEWSPDGSAIVYTREIKDRTQIRVMDVASRRSWALPLQRFLGDHLPGPRFGCCPVWLTALGVFVHPFRSNPYTDSGVFVHPLGRPA